MVSQPRSVPRAPFTVTQPRPSEQYLVSCILGGAAKNVVILDADRFSRMHACIYYTLACFSVPLTAVTHFERIKFQTKTRVWCYLEHVVPSRQYVTASILVHPVRSGISARDDITHVHGIPEYRALL